MNFLGEQVSSLAALLIRVAPRACIQTKATCEKGSGTTTKMMVMMRRASHTWRAVEKRNQQETFFAFLAGINQHILHVILTGLNFGSGDCR